MAAHPAALEHSPLSNPDIAPIPGARRTWNWWHYCALWIGMSVCITTYTLASGLIDAGMSWRQVMATIFLGNCIVLVPMLTHRFSPAEYGILDLLVTTVFLANVVLTFGFDTASAILFLQMVCFADGMPFANEFFGLSCAAGLASLHLPLREKNIAIDCA